MPSVSGFRVPGDSRARVPARLRDNVKLVHNVCGANRLRVASLSTGSGPWLIIFDPFRVESVLLNLSALTHRLSMTARRMPVGCAFNEEPASSHSRADSYRIAIGRSQKHSLLCPGRYKHCDTARAWRRPQFPSFPCSGGEPHISQRRGPPAGVCV